MRKSTNKVRLDSMKVFPLNDAKTHLSKLATAAAGGEEVIITRYGRPLARLGPVQPASERTLGFYPIAFVSDLSSQAEGDSTDEDTLLDFEGRDG